MNISSISGSIAQINRWTYNAAKGVLFLSIPRSNYITGEIIDVNGGLVMD